MLRTLWGASILVVSFLVFATGGACAEQVVRLGELDLSKMSSGWGKPLVDESVTGKAISIGGQQAKAIDVPLAGVERPILIVTSAGDGTDFDHADWAQAEFVIAGGKPQAVDAPQPAAEERIILTPKAGPQPKINGPKVYGARPGKPFIYRIPCTGKRPIQFTATNLPQGLQLDAGTGIIAGRVPEQRGEMVVTLGAKNEHGTDQRTFKIVVGDTLALTPPMGWNSWYIHYIHVTEEHMRNAADVMISSGMADYGYQYVNIDDCWMKQKGDEPYRDNQGAILPNAKFPNITGMVDYIHGKGLRAGLYTGPGPWTCGGYVGSYEHEQIDARKFAEWGFDFLKYDWCSYGEVAGGNSLEHLQRPYKKMGDILKELPRDIVYNLCQYGMGDVWTWGAEVGGHCWRTTGDLGLEQGALLPGFYNIGLSNARHYGYAGPGRWNDPDYILIGWVGNAQNQNEPGQPTKLTPNEQYSYMSMWCLMAAPLFFSGDMAKLDNFTLNVLCNAEVIEVDQDPLGKQAKPVVQDNQTLVLAKPMEDGSLTVGLFNLAELPREMRIDWSSLAIEGKQQIRDLWRQRDLGIYADNYSAEVSRHGVTLIHISSIR